MLLDLKGICFRLLLSPPPHRALRQDPELRDVVISVDTFYASVAREAVDAGADIVNDVSGGTLDPGMFEQVRLAVQDGRGPTVPTCLLASCF